MVQAKQRFRGSYPLWITFAGGNEDSTVHEAVRFVIWSFVQHPFRDIEMTFSSSTARYNQRNVMSHTLKFKSSKLSFFPSSGSKCIAIYVNIIHLVMTDRCEQKEGPDTNCSAHLCQRQQWSHFLVILLYIIVYLHSCFTFCLPESFHHAHTTFAVKVHCTRAI